MDDLRQQSQTRRVSRPSRSSLIAGCSAGAFGALMHSVLLPLAFGSGTAFIAFAAMLAAGIGLIGSLVGVAGAWLLPTSKAGRVLAAGTLTFVATLAVGSMPGLIGGLGRAVFVSVAVVCTLILAEWLQNRAVNQQAP